MTTKTVLLQPAFDFAESTYQNERRPQIALRDLPVDERPLPRLQFHGAASLTNAELLDIVVSNGKTAGMVLLTQFGSLSRIQRVPYQVLARVLGPRRAAAVQAAFELGRRAAAGAPSEMPRITCPADAAHILMPQMQDLQQEELRIMTLTTKNQVIRIVPLYRGTLNMTNLRVAEVIAIPIEDRADSFLVAHNHPSGNSEASPEDVAAMRSIQAAARLMDLTLLDALVVGRSSWVSFKERGLLTS